MSYLDTLKNSKSKEQVVYQEFMLSVKHSTEHFFAFFEGGDNAYYYPRIAAYTQNIKTFFCGGRDAVLKVYDLIIIHSEYDKYKKGFFIDRDFNPPLPSRTPPIFETSCYAIENFYVSVDVFERILANVFHLSNIRHPEYTVFLNHYTGLQQQFHDAVLLFNAWYACLIDIRNKTGVQTGVNLDDCLPKDALRKSFVIVTLASVTNNYDMAKILATFPAAPSLPNHVLQAKITEFQACVQYQTFRGKYELNFLMDFLNVANGQNIGGYKFKYPFAGATNTIERYLQMFTSYADTPDELRDYLKIVTA
jgi:Protein of unknown function (DUF4435)